MIAQQPTIMEVARQICVNRFITHVLGGLFPANLPSTSLTNILEIACGVGTWSLDVGATYPEKQIVGLDPDSALLDYAETQRIAQSLDNVCFQQVKTLAHLPQRDASFDLVSGRFLLPRIPESCWPPILWETRRVLQPGASLTLIECAFARSNSPALEQYYRNRTALESIKPCSSPSAETDRPVVEPLLSRLENAGYQQIQCLTKTIDASFKKSAWAAFLQNFIVQFKVLKPMMVEVGIAANEDLDDIYTQVLHEMREEAFEATLYGYLVWGKN